MKHLLLALLAVSSAAAQASAYGANGINANGNANGGPTCNAHVIDSCLEPGSGWESGPCNAVYGGFRGNADNLHKLMAAQIRDSFKFLVMGSHFSSDEVNRLGLHSLLQSHSDAAWESGKALMQYILKRGGRMGNHFRADKLSLQPTTTGEVEALGEALDMLKSHAGDLVTAHRHAMSKRHGDDGDEFGSYDPDVAHFLGDKIGGATGSVREMAGHLNVLARIARDDRSRGLGLHLYDHHLLN